MPIKHSKFYRNVEACGCQNAQGDRKIGDQCGWYGQWREKVEPEYANLVSRPHSTAQ